MLLGVTTSIFPVLAPEDYCLVWAFTVREVRRARMAQPLEFTAAVLPWNGSGGDHKCLNRRFETIIGEGAKLENSVPNNEFWGTRLDVNGG
jgi:hypothetical protein